MNKKTEIKVRQGDPELTTSKKLDQIKTGAKIKRQTGGTELLLKLLKILSRLQAEYSFRTAQKKNLRRVKL